MTAGQGGPGSPVGRRLAWELLRLRQSSGFSGDVVARKIGVSPSKLSRIEKCRTGIQPDTFDKLMELYGVPGARRAELCRLAEEDREPLAGSPGEPTFDETTAQVVLEWAPVMVPVLLRTEAYAEALLHRMGRILLVPPAQARRTVAAITRWQARLEKGEVQLQAVLDESVLYRRFAGPDVMHGQIQRLADAAALPNVSIRVLPALTEDRPPINAFTYLRYAELAGARLPDAVVGERLDGDRWREDEENRVYRHSVAFERLWDAAAGEQLSIGMIKRRLRG